MKIRRLNYQINYVHVLAFKEQYKEAVAPYFPFDNVSYGIDNEGTINESIRLIYNNENFAISFRKDSLSFLFEGDHQVSKEPNGPLKLFWDLFEKTKKFRTFSNTSMHIMIAHAVDIKEKAFVQNLLDNNSYLKFNPFGKLDEFSCNFEFTKNMLKYKVNFGNYSPNDIIKHDLAPFKSEFNKDLENNVGVMGVVEIHETDKNVSFSKFKTLLHKTEEAFKSLEESDENQVSH